MSVGEIAEPHGAGYVETMQYATPVPRTGARVWAGALIVVAGLALVVLGGCFLIGVMLTVNNGFTPNPVALNPAKWGLVVTLYCLAFVCFGAAIYLMFLGIRGLLRTLHGGG